MNWIDFIILILLVFGLARGYINGFIKELASLLALILGIWGAIKFSTWTAAKMYDYFDMTGRYVGIIAFLVTFILIVVVIHFLGLLIDRFTERLSLGFLNSFLGMIFGIFKSALFLSVIFVILNAIDAKHHFLPRETIAKSRFYNPIADLAPAVFPVIGEGGFDKSFDRFKKDPDVLSI